MLAQCEVRSPSPPSSPHATYYCSQGLQSSLALLVLFGSFDACALPLKLAFLGCSECNSGHHRNRGFLDGLRRQRPLLPPPRAPVFVSASPPRKASLTTAKTLLRQRHRLISMAPCTSFSRRTPASSSRQCAPCRSRCDATRCACAAAALSISIDTGAVPCAQLQPRAKFSSSLLPTQTPPVATAADVPMSAPGPVWRRARLPQPTTQAENAQPDPSDFDLDAFLRSYHQQPANPAPVAASPPRTPTNRKLAKDMSEIKGLLVQVLRQQTAVPVHSVSAAAQPLPAPTTSALNNTTAPYNDVCGVPMSGEPNWTPYRRRASFPRSMRTPPQLLSTACKSPSWRVSTSRRRPHAGCPTALQVVA